jgi:DNA-binding transcriptional regulator LsrR (DeoR family)
MLTPHQGEAIVSRGSGTRAEIGELVQLAAKAVVDYYDRPITALDETWAIDLRIDADRRRKAQGETARRLVNEVLAEGGSHRQIAVAAHLPGLLVIKLITDTQEAADAYAAEIHHLERSLNEVRDARIRDARLRYEAGEKKTDLAASYGVTRPTLDKWLDATADTEQ